MWERRSNGAAFARLAPYEGVLSPSHRLDLSAALRMHELVSRFARHNCLNHIQYPLLILLSKTPLAIEPASLYYQICLSSG